MTASLASCSDVASLVDRDEDFDVVVGQCADEVRTRHLLLRDCDVTGVDELGGARCADGPDVYAQRRGLPGVALLPRLP